LAASEARIAPAVIEDGFAQARPAAIILQPISNAACKPQAKDSDMTAAKFVRRNVSGVSSRYLQCFSLDYGAAWSRP
jgi:hypothetical protein